MKNRRPILEGVKAAAHLHQEFDIRQQVESQWTRIDVFGTIVRENIPLLFRPLDNLLGAYLPRPNQGIIITTQRPLSVQRFTGSHELGHAAMGHEGSIDDESLLTRSPFGSKTYEPFEIAADSFATHFLLPRWLFVVQAARHKWSRQDLADPRVVYQLSLRAGASYQATCMALLRHELIDQATLSRLFAVEVKKIKQLLLDGHNLETWHPDVWVLTEADEGTVIEGDSRDAFILRLKETSGAGYLWNVDQLKEAGFVLFRDERLISDAEGDVGGPVERVVGARSDLSQLRQIALHQTRPWQKNGPPLSSFSFTFDLRGKESGRPRAERRHPVAA